jgi:hypothetical protein
MVAHVVGMDAPLSEHIRQDFYFETAILGAHQQVLEVAMPVLGIEHAHCIEERTADYQSSAEGNHSALCRCAGLFGKKVLHVGCATHQLGAVVEVRHLHGAFLRIPDIVRIEKGHEIPMPRLRAVAGPALAWSS